MKKLIVLMVLVSVLCCGFNYNDPNINGIIDRDITLPPGNYKTVGFVQVENGSTLTIGPGASISGMIESYGGDIKVIGNKDLKAKIINVRIWLREPSQITIRFAEVNNSTIEIKFGNLILTNSMVNDSHIQIHGSKNSYIQSNDFNNSNIISACENEIKVYVKANIFNGESSILSNALITNFGERYLGFTLDTIINNNNFMGNEVGLRVIGSGQMEAKNNFWSNSNIDWFIYDRNDDLDCGFFIDYEPILSEAVDVDTSIEAIIIPVSPSINEPEPLDPNSNSNSKSKSFPGQNTLHVTNEKMDNQPIEKKKNDNNGGCFIFSLFLDH